jgi:hypothetical protein
MDQRIHDLPRVSRFKQIDPLLYALHRRSVQRDAQREFHIRSLVVFKEKFYQRRSDESYDAVRGLVDVIRDVFWNPDSCQV